MFQMLKYLIEALIVSLVAYLIGRNQLTITEIILIGLSALISGIVLDYLHGWILFEEIVNTPIEATRPIDTVITPEVQVVDNLPFHFDQSYPSQPKPDAPKTHPISWISDIHSRWMNWLFPAQPLNQNTDQYALYPGHYASRIVRPGYHENIDPANQQHLDQLSPKIWADDHNPLDRTMYTYQGQSVVPMTGGGNGETLVDRPMNLPVNQIATPVARIDDQGIRLTDVIYSGDLIELSAGLNLIQRATNNSQLLLDKPLPQIRTNISKLRFEHAVKNDRLSNPIRYGELINIKHNALIDNTNKTRSIKYGERLQSHQDGPTYDIFKIFNKNNVDSTDYVKYGDQFVIACGDQTGNKVFLKLENDRSISAEAIVEDSIIFSAKLLKPFDPSNLCICPDEIIYP